MSEAISIRHAEPGDVDAISTIVRRCFRETLAVHHSQAHIDHQDRVWTPEHIRRLLSWPGRYMLVACMGCDLVGTACLYRDSVRKVFVAPDWQSRGIGRLLMLRVEQEAVARSISTLQVQTSANAAQFYRKLGYVVVGERRIENEPFILLAKVLKPA